MSWESIKCRKTWIETMEKEIERLEGGDITAIRSVYGTFLSDNKVLIQSAGRAIRKNLEKYSQEQMIHLYERFREMTSLEWWIDWKDVSVQKILSCLQPEDARYVLILGTFHPNGYFRERCMCVLSEQEGALPYLLLRANDWVYPVREKAFELIWDYLGHCDLAEILKSVPALEKLHRSGRRSDENLERLERFVSEQFQELITKSDWMEHLHRMDFSERKYLYRLAIRRKLMTLEQMEKALYQEKNSYGGMILIRGILANPECTVERAEVYLHHKSPQIRRRALEYKYEHVKNCWPGLEKLLLDAGRGVREYAVYILEKYSDLDIRGYYLEHLCDEPPENVILGLSEYSHRGNVQQLLRFLEHPTQKVLQCTLLALGRQEDFVDEELLWQYLLDGRINISKAAYLSIQKRDFYPGAQRIYDAYRKEEKEHIRRYLLNLLLRERAWERLPYCLLLYRKDLPEKEARQILRGMWGRPLHTQIPETQKEVIRKVLEERQAELPEPVVTDILFELRFV